MEAIEWRQSESDPSKVVLCFEDHHGKAWEFPLDKKCINHLVQMSSPIVELHFTATGANETLKRKCDFHGLKPLAGAKKRGFVKKRPKDVEPAPATTDPHRMVIAGYALFRGESFAHEGSWLGMAGWQTEVFSFEATAERGQDSLWITHEGNGIPGAWVQLADGRKQTCDEGGQLVVSGEKGVTSQIKVGAEGFQSVACQLKGDGSTHHIELKPTPTASKNHQRALVIGGGVLTVLLCLVLIPGLNGPTLEENPPLPVPVPVEPPPRVNALIVEGPPTPRTIEGGEAQRFNLRLSAPPGDAVEITLNSTNPLEGTVNPNQVTIESDGWERGQPFKITPVDDQIQDGDKRYKVLLKSKSQDVAFNDLSHEMLVVNADNDHGLSPFTPPRLEFGDITSGRDYLQNVAISLNDGALELDFQGAVFDQDLSHSGFDPLGVVTCSDGGMIRIQADQAAHCRLKLNIPRGSYLRPGDYSGVLQFKAPQTNKTYSLPFNMKFLP